MLHNFHISNFFGGLVQAQIKFKPVFTYPICNKFIIQCVQALKREGFINSYKLDVNIKNRNVHKIIIYLKYSKNIPLITNFEMISTPGGYKYLSVYKLLHFVKTHSHFAQYFLATDRGVLTHRQCLIFKTGGKLLFKLN